MRAESRATDREITRLGISGTSQIRFSLFSKVAEESKQQLSSTYFNSPILPNRGEHATSRRRRWRRYNSPLCRRQCTVMSANALKGPSGECVQKAIVPPVKQVYESFF